MVSDPIKDEPLAIAVRRAYEKDQAEGESPQDLAKIRQKMDQALTSIETSGDDSLLKTLASEIKPDGTI